MKTVLAPKAPWPVPVEAKPAKRKPKLKMDDNKVEKNFERWLSKISPVKPKGKNNA